jgi:ribosomal protein S18 acetylase RimI-like enzyme
MKCERLTRSDAQTLSALNVLLGQLSSSAEPMTAASLNTILKNKNFYLMVLRGDNGAGDKRAIIGMGSLVVWHAPAGIRSRIEDVVVDETHRGRGLGTVITKKLIDTARAVKAKDIQLSSRPSRVAANGLYKKLGFEQKETNVYVYKLKR